MDVHLKLLFHLARGGSERARERANKRGGGSGRMSIEHGGGKARMSMTVGVRML